MKLPNKFVFILCMQQFYCIFVGFKDFFTRFFFTLYGDLGPCCYANEHVHPQAGAEQL